jgi:uncharacterized SAM-binding protein YcdF (DUF218 family)
MMRLPSDARWLNRLQFAAACLGLLLIAATAGYPLHEWTAALSTPWISGNGGVLIVLGGDIVAPDMIGMTSFWRSVYAVREWRTGRYSRILITGKDIAPLMRDFIVGQGVPAQFVQVEGAAASTRENALNVARLLREDVNPKVLLTSDFHMRRALGAFRKAGIEASPVPIPDAHKRLSDWTQRWGIFCILLDETAKLAYYKVHDWV